MWVTQFLASICPSSGCWRYLGRETAQSISVSPHCHCTSMKTNVDSYSYWKLKISHFNIKKSLVCELIACCIPISKFHLICVEYINSKLKYYNVLNLLNGERRHMPIPPASILAKAFLKWRFEIKNRGSKCISIDVFIHLGICPSLQRNYCSSYPLLNGFYSITFILCIPYHSFITKYQQQLKRLNGVLLPSLICPWGTLWKNFSCL